MIEIRYEERVENRATGAITYLVLGTEVHSDIEEVLLPLSPNKSPIFFTKKFLGHPEYRWEVKEVLNVQQGKTVTFVVRLTRRQQVEKEFYLKNIVARQNRGIRRVLHEWSLVEVEFGHALCIGKTGGQFRSNKRYADTVQLHSMPKRRLAIVVHVIPRQNEDLLQVIPISSQQPTNTDKASVEVTSQLSTMHHYKQRSWAICRMIQTVTASRVLAPSVQIVRSAPTRDRGFRNKIRGSVREEVKDALMHGVAAEGRLATSAALMTEKAITATQATKIQELEERIALYEKFIEYSNVTVDDLYQWFPGPSAST